MQTILVPLDGSPAGTLALGTAHVLARATGARLVLRQIVVPASSYMVHASAVHSAVYLDPRWDEDAVRGAREYIQALTGHLSGEGLQCEGDVLIEDSVADALVRIASEQRADLIVMSTEAHTGAARAILGSVTDAVVRGSSSPVLVLRRDAA
jgi:nucleotide-binding universal stress UspA family protein